MKSINLIIDIIVGVFVGGWLLLVYMANFMGQ